MKNVTVEKTTQVTFRVNQKLKNEADKIFSELGMNMTTGIVMYLAQTVRDRKIPFQPSLNDWSAHNQSSHIPNTETLEAMAEVEEMEKTHLLELLK